jgi:hypothetical protein
MYWLPGYFNRLVGCKYTYPRTRYVHIIFKFEDSDCRPANGNIRIATIAVSQDWIGPSTYSLKDRPMIVSRACLPLGAGGDGNVIRQLSIETSM